MPEPTDFDFSNLDAFAVAPDETRRYKLPITLDYRDASGELVTGPSPVLVVLPATTNNKAYTNASLKSSQRRNAGQVRQVNVEMLNANRQEERELYARHVLRGWEGVVNAKGVAVPYSREAGAAWLARLPDYLFDGLRLFCSSPENFVEEGAGVDAGALAKK